MYIECIEDDDDDRRESKRGGKGLSKHGKDRVRDLGDGWSRVEHGAGYYKEPFPDTCGEMNF